jgi:hypothetical protein
MPPLAIQELFSLPASAKVDSILATVPDPLHSRLALFTDGSLDAIEATVGAAGWVFAAQWIPWRDPIDEGAKDPSARRKQRYFARQQEEQPGVLVFRRVVRGSDFAIFVFAGEDVLKWRRRVTPAPRDNVVLEIGMAIGILGHRRLSLLYSVSDRAKIPSDLQGFTYVPFNDIISSRVGIAQASEIIRQQLIAEGLRQFPSDADHLITQSQRSTFSTEFAEKCVHSLDIFAGDLSWLNRDLPTYRSLRQRGVRIRFLTDSPHAAVIRKARTAGIQFKVYPTGAEARIMASISDADTESGVRALVVQKTTLPPNAEDLRKPYDYRMKIYHGPREYPVIRAFSDYFEALFERGRAL